MKRYTGAVALTVILLLSVCCRQPTYRSRAEVASAMTSLSQAKQYERAIEVGRNWITNHPDDSVIHEQLGMVFLSYANSNPTQRSSLLNSASAQFEHSIRLAPDNALEVFNGAWGLAAIGDSSSGSFRCVSYKKANTALQQVEQLLRNEQQPSPLREAYDGEISRLRAKMDAARCH